MREDGMPAPALLAIFAVVAFMLGVFFIFAAARMSKKVTGQ